MAGKNWTLIWADEFDGLAGRPVDPTRWTHEIGGHGWGNNEHQYYTDRPANASLDGESHLAMVARLAEGEVLPGWHGNCGYTSARLISHQKFEVQYGRIEARLQVPHGQGIWPAFWMLGSNMKARWAGRSAAKMTSWRRPVLLLYTVHGTVHGPEAYSGMGGISGGKTTLNTPIAEQFTATPSNGNPM
ncbi:MAG: glycoside hydrolase family 16 protein [Anaerolineae bacterium]